jgi:hypothetical protein
MLVLDQRGRNICLFVFLLTTNWHVAGPQIFVPFLMLIMYFCLTVETVDAETQTDGFLFNEPITNTLEIINEDKTEVDFEQVDIEDKISAIEMNQIADGVEVTRAAHESLDTRL